jgi:AraC-like DNA-binding protein
MEKAYSSTDFYGHQLFIRQNLFDGQYSKGFSILKGNELVSEPDSIIDPYSVSNGALRLTSLFFEILDKQFPICFVGQKMKCRFPVDFAGMASVHVNHLNRCLKDITGKTTSQHIADRLVKEAQTLLKHTEWNVCEIGYCFGFEEGPHFINFFKKNAKMSPTAYRRMIRSEFSKVKEILIAKRF